MVLNQESLKKHTVYQSECFLSFYKVWINLATCWPLSPDICIARDCCPLPRIARPSLNQETSFYYQVCAFGTAHTLEIPLSGAWRHRFVYEKAQCIFQICWSTFSHAKRTRNRMDTNWWNDNFSKTKNLLSLAMSFTHLKPKGTDRRYNAVYGFYT